MGITTLVKGIYMTKFFYLYSLPFSNLAQAFTLMHWMTPQFPYPDDVINIDFRCIISTSVTFHCASELGIAHL